MEFVDRADDRSESIPIERCRELLGDEAVALSDQEIALIRRHAETMVYIVVEMYFENRRISE